MYKYNKREQYTNHEQDQQGSTGAYSGLWCNLKTK